MKRWFIPLLAVAALGYAAYSINATRPVRSQTLPPAPPPTNPYPNTVAAVGLVEPASENISISTVAPGLVTQVFVHAGQNVRRGEALFTIDDRDLRAEAELRRRNHQVAEARLARLAASPRPEELPPVEARVREAESALADARIQFDLIAGVTDKRAIRAEDLERRRQAVKTQQARVEEAKAALTLLRAGTWKPDLEVARTEVEQALAQVKRVETDITRLTMRSPIDGQVLQLNVRAGEYAQIGQLARPLIIMGDVSVLHVRADIDENDAHKVQAGSMATAAERGNSTRRAKLSFVRFEPYVVPKRSLTGDNVERVDTRVMQAIYRFDDAKAGFRPGQQMDVYIQLSGAAK
jgi:HlyD family secretion protein